MENEMTLSVMTYRYSKKAITEMMADVEGTGNCVCFFCLQIKPFGRRTRKVTICGFPVEVCTECTDKLKEKEYEETCS